MIKDDESGYKRRDMKGGQQPAEHKIRRRLGGGAGGPNTSKRYNDPHPDKRDDFRGGPGHGGMMPMDRDFHHERDREFMQPPYPFRSYDDYHLGRSKKKKRGPQDGGPYNDERGNRGPNFMYPHGAGYYPMPPYGHEPYYYGVGPGYGRDGPRPDRQDDRKGMSMQYPDNRRGEPYNKSLPPGRDQRGYPGNFDSDRPMMRDQPMGMPHGMMNRRDGPNAPMRDGRPGG